MSRERRTPAPHRGLVPPLTEAIAASAPEPPVGVTHCRSHPADPAAERIGGTENPDPARIPAPVPAPAVLPDEPYALGPGDGPERFPEPPAALVDGRSPTRHGPSPMEAPRRPGAVPLDPPPPAGGPAPGLGNP